MIQNPWGANFAGHYGFIIPHAESLEAVSGSNPVGFQMDIYRHLNTQAVWDQCNCYPRIGISSTVFHYNNPEVLGNSYNIAGFIEPFLNFKSRIQFSFRMAFGVSLLDQVYNAETNPTNLFYSSPISFILQAGATLHYHINQDWNLRSGVLFGHISNGGIEKPNKGMNFPTFSLGVEYKWQSVYLKDRQSSKSLSDIHPKKWLPRVFFFNGMKEVNEGEKKHYVFGLNASFSRVVSKINAINGGIEWISDGSVREKNRRTGQKLGDSHSVSMLLGNELLMGRFMFSQHIGTYINKPSFEGDRFFHRWGLSYKLNPVMIGVNLKAHRHIADILDFRIGISF